MTNTPTPGERAASVVNEWEHGEGDCGSHSRFLGLIDLIASAIRAAEEAAFLKGFNISGQGWNGEYPFDDQGKDPTADPHWLAARESALKSKEA